jgi:hypothetical protein
MIMMEATSLKYSEKNFESIPKSLRNRSVGGTFLLILAISSLCGYRHQHGYGHAPLRSTEVDFLRSTKVDFGVVESSSIMLSAASSGTAAATALVAVATGSSLDMLVMALKPVLLELGVVVILQSVGVPMVSTLGLLARRVRWASIGRGIGVSATAIKHLKLTLKVGGKVWKELVLTYTKTSASKIVGRSKRIIKHVIKQQIYHHDGNDGAREQAVEVH